MNNFFSGRASRGERTVTARSGTPRTIIPTLEPDPNTDTIIDGTILLTDRVTIGCRADGLPEASITWFRTDNFGPEMEVNTSLSTFNVTSPEPGQSFLTIDLDFMDTRCFLYICRANNGIGTVDASAQVCPERKFYSH